jgi:uncharacterized repeat protein (TIGR02543 family)
MKRIGIYLVVLLTFSLNLNGVGLRVIAYGEGQDGSSENPYVITTPQELQDMNSDLDAYYVLGNNLDMTGFTWEHIGEYGDPFVGELNGAGFEIFNLTLPIYVTNIFEENIFAAGMFGAIGQNARLFNFGLQYTISALNIETGDTSVMVGGLSTLVEGYYNIDINNIWVDGDIELSTSNTFRYTSVGGLFGEVYMVKNLTALSFTGSIKVDAENSGMGVGGIVGFGEDFSINDSRVASATIETGSSIEESGVGGMIGWVEYYDDYLSDSDVVFRNSVVSTSVKTGNYVHAGGLLGIIVDDDDNDMYATRNYLKDLIIIGGRGVGGFVGYSYYMDYVRNEIQDVDVETCDDFSQEFGDVYLGVGGFVGYSLNDYIRRLVISEAKIGLGDSVNRVGGIAGTAEDGSYRYIDFSGEIKSTGDRVGGVVGHSLNNDIEYTSINAIVEGDSYVGGIIGQSTGYDYLSSVSFVGTLTGYMYVGGLVGEKEGDSLEIYNAYARGTFTADRVVGGLIGFSQGEVYIANAYFAGTLEKQDTLPSGGFTPSGFLSTLIDPINCTSVDVSLEDVFYDNTLYTGSSLFSNTGYATFQFQDVTSDVAGYLGVDLEFEYENSFFLFSGLNDGYFSLWGDRDYVLYMSEDEAVGVQLTFGSIVFDETDEFTNDNVSQYIYWEEMLDPEVIVRTGYTFKGWSSDTSGEDMVDVEMYELEGNTTLYAQWTSSNHSISFESNLGSLVDKITQAPDSVVTKPTDPTRAHYVFKGWFSDKECTAAYTFGKMPAEDITLYAAWSLEKFDVVFVDYDQRQLSSQSIAYGSSATAPSSPVRSGYRFMRWDEAYSTITKNLTVTALYEKITEDISNASDGLDPKVEDLAEAINFTQAELDPLHSLKIKLDMTIESLDNLSSDNKALIEEFEADLLEDGLYTTLFIDINLFKVIDEVSSKVYTTDQPITITFKISESLYTKDFKLIKLHTNSEGVTSLTELEYTYNSETHEITFMTNEFSVFGLVSATTKLPYTGENTNSGLFFLILSLLLAVLSQKRKIFAK